MKGWPGKLVFNGIESRSPCFGFWMKTYENPSFWIPFQCRPGSPQSMPTGIQTFARLEWQIDAREPEACALENRGEHTFQHRSLNGNRVLSGSLSGKKQGGFRQQTLSFGLQSANECCGSFESILQPLIQHGYFDSWKLKKQCEFSSDGYMKGQQAKTQDIKNVRIRVS